MAESDELSVDLSKVIILIEDHIGISFVCEKDKHLRVGPACEIGRASCRERV